MATLEESPTKQIYADFENAYRYFNRALFGGMLPACLITIERKGGAYGYFANNRFRTADDSDAIKHGISLNPSYFGKGDVKDVLSTLVHEMVHFYQSHQGIHSAAGYHNRKWVQMMIDVGLMPSDTGKPGGKMTGYSMSHYILLDGAFDRAYKKFSVNHTLRLYQDLFKIDKLKATSKTKYVCIRCKVNAWAKPEVILICGRCRKPLKPQIFLGGRRVMKARVTTHEK